MTVKEKFAAAKEKIKSNAPEIAAAAVVIAPVVIGIVVVVKQFKTSSGIFEPMTPVDDATRNSLFKNKDFLLYKLSENEYILDRPVPLDQ